MADPGRDLSSELFATDTPSTGKDLSGDLFGQSSDGWQPTKYGFDVKPIDLGNGGTSVQRKDGAVYFGPGQGNKGKPGWFDSNGNRMGDAPGKGLSFTDATLNQMHQSNQYGQQHPILSNFVTPQMAGMAQGLVDTAALPTNLAAHAVGSATGNPEIGRTSDQAVNALEQNYQTFPPSPAGRMVGQAMPFLATAGGSAAPAAASNVSKVKAALEALKTVGKAAGVGAVVAPAMTADTNTQNDEEYWAKKKKEALLGGVTGGALGTIAPAVKLAGAVKGGLAKAGETPSATEVLGELEAKLGGQTPGEALQGAAKAKYDAAWDEFKTAIAPVDKAAGNVSVDYTPAIDKLNEVLGTGGKRPPMPLDKETVGTLQDLLTNLQEAGQPGGNVDSSFAGAIDMVKGLGDAQRKLAATHGSTQARNILEGVRDSVLQSMQESSPQLSQAAEDARKVFAEKVVPLFDKKQGGNFLTAIRDSPRPEDLLASGNQGSLARMQAGKAAIIAKGSSADPMLYSYLDAALKQADGNPGIFSKSLKKAMPAIEAIADPDTLKAFQGLVKIADTSKVGGSLANLGLAAIPGYHEVGAMTGLGLNFKPSISGPGLLWKLLQSPATRKLLTYAGKMPAGSPELELIAKDLSKTGGLVAASPAANIAPLKTLPTAAQANPPEKP